MITPQTNTDIPSFAAALAACESFAITGHINPDGDCLGSQLALGLALRKMGKSVDFLLVEDTPVEYGLRFLPSFDEMIPAADYRETPEAFITVDVSVRGRIGACADVLERVQTTFSLDHHASEETLSQYLYVDPDAASTTMLVWDVITALGVAPTPDIALCAYTGLMTDTGRFQYQNTDENAFAHASQMIAAGADPSRAAREVFQSRSLASLRLEERMLAHMELLHGGRFAFSFITLDDFAACDAVKADAEPLIDTLRAIRGVSVACILKEQPGMVRGSLRAKDASDVSAIARTLGGGGHKAAAGFTSKLSLDQTSAAVKDGVATLFGAA